MGVYKKSTMLCWCLTDFWSCFLQAIIISNLIVLVLGFRRDWIQVAFSYTVGTFLLTESTPQMCFMREQKIKCSIASESSVNGDDSTPRSLRFPRAPPLLNGGPCTLWSGPVFFLDPQKPCSSNISAILFLLEGAGVPRSLFLRKSLLTKNIKSKVESDTAVPCNFSSGTLKYPQCSASIWPHLSACGLALPVLQLQRFSSLLVYKNAEHQCVKTAEV